MTESKHMSETTDALDLAQDIVALDNACRDTSQEEGSARFFSADAYDDAATPLGKVPVYEGNLLSLAGADINHQGELRIIMRTVSSVEALDDEPVRFHLAINELEDFFPRTFDIVNALSRQCNDNDHGLGPFAYQCWRTYAGKPSLLEASRLYIKEGRRAYLEGVHEREEIASDAFYEQNAEDFGLF